MSNLMHKILLAIEDKLEEILTDSRVAVRLASSGKPAPDADGCVIIFPDKLQTQRISAGITKCIYRAKLKAEVFSRASEDAEMLLDALLKKIADALGDTKLNISDDELVQAKTVSTAKTEYPHGGEASKNKLSATLALIVETFEK